MLTVGCTAGSAGTKSNQTPIPLLQPSCEVRSRLMWPSVLYIFRQNTHVEFESLRRVYRRFIQDLPAA
jgi:hypothetical protein